MRKMKALRRALLAATKSMVQGGLSETFRSCGKATCPCHDDPTHRHGPHLYLTYRADGASRSLYVPPDHVLDHRVRDRGVEPRAVTTTVATRAIRPPSAGASETPA